MKFFDYESIYLAANGDPAKMLEYYREYDTGKDFIVNPKALVDAFWLSDKLKAEYLGLCALRNYNDYYYDNNVHLGIERIPIWIPVEVIKENPLVKLTDSKLIFLKEE